MRNLKKFLALVLAMMMVFSMMVTVNAASLDGYTDSSDVKSDYATAVNILSQIGIFRGTDGKFNPNDTLSRAEASTLIYRVISGDVTDAQVSIYKNYGKFSDVSDDYWAAGYINYAHNGRYVVGDGTGKFNPGDKINGYQLLAILLRAIGYGKNGEFQGSGWEIRTATAANELGITKGINEGTLGQDITRQIVAQIIYNALGVEMVRWTNALSYLKEGKSLITLTSAGGLDDWGVPSTKYTAVWNKVPGTTKTASLPEKALVTYDKEVDECQVFTDIGATGSSTTATTFTNGVVNKGTQVIEATDTTNIMKTAQGRETTVYKNPGNITGVTGAYIIVYKDTFFGEITGVTHVIKDNNGHTIVPAMTAIDVYGGEIVDGAVDGYGVATVYVQNDTTGVKGNYVSLNVLETATSFVAVNVNVLTPTTETVKNVTRGTRGTINTYISFQTTGDKTYLYNHTYGSYANIFNYRLDNTDIGQSYKVYTDAKGNVLGLITANAASVGVVTNFKLVDEGKGIWSVDFEITTYDSAAKTTSTYTVRAYYYDQVEPRTDRTNTEKWAEALLNTLVTVSNDLDYSGYSILTQSSAYTPVPNDMVGGRYYFWANDNTVYFIAQYDGKGNLVGFEPVVGFKNIDVLVGNPLMMSAEQDPVTGVWYVVVYRVSNTLDLPTPNSPVPNYAYIQTDDEFRTEYADYYVYYAVIDGKEDSLLVRKTAARPSNGTGLYTYTVDRNGYASNFSWVSAAANPDRGGNITYQNDSPKNNIYTYNAGVLYVGIHAGDALYKTVDDDVKIYIINNKFGEVTPAGGYENLETAVIYANAEECNIAYTCNKYGWIDTLYVIDNHTDAPPAATPTDLGIIFKQSVAAALGITTYTSTSTNIWVDGSTKLPTDQYSNNYLDGHVMITLKANDDDLIITGRTAGTYLFTIDGFGTYTVTVGADGYFKLSNMVLNALAADAPATMPSTITISKIEFNPVKIEVTDGTEKFASYYIYSDVTTEEIAIPEGYAVTQVKADNSTAWATPANYTVNDDGTVLTLKLNSVTMSNYKGHTITVTVAGPSDFTFTVYYLDENGNPVIMGEKTMAIANAADVTEVTIPITNGLTGNYVAVQPDSTFHYNSGAWSTATVNGTNGTISYDAAKKEVTLTWTGGILWDAAIKVTRLAAATQADYTATAPALLDLTQFSSVATKYNDLAIKVEAGETPDVINIKVDPTKLDTLQKGKTNWNDVEAIMYGLIPGSNSAALGSVANAANGLLFRADVDVTFDLNSVAIGDTGLVAGPNANWYMVEEWLQDGKAPADLEKLFFNSQDGKLHIYVPTFTRESAMSYWTIKEGSTLSLKFAMNGKLYSYTINIVTYDSTAG